MELSEREKLILRHIIRQFIATAAPVGSRNISKFFDIGLSPATVRNVMADLEDAGLIDHPHTSAGRVPTDRGYRLYVDSLMDKETLPDTAKVTIGKKIEQSLDEGDDLLSVVSSILGEVSQQLAWVVFPMTETGVLERLQLVLLDGNRLLVMLHIKSGTLKSIKFEVQSSIKESQVVRAEQLLNERLAGLKLQTIRETLPDRVRGISEGIEPIVDIFVESADRIFCESSSSKKVALSGVKNLIAQPEFETPAKVQNIIDFIENKRLIVSVVEEAMQHQMDEINIAIGQEIRNVKMEDYSFVIKEYRAGDIVGTLGILGPKRMQYDKIVCIVDYISKVFSGLLTSKQ